MIAAFALTAGGVYLILKRREPRKGALMIVAAIVMLGNDHQRALAPPALRSGTPPASEAKAAIIGMDRERRDRS